MDLVPRYVPFIEVFIYPPPLSKFPCRGSTLDKLDELLRRLTGEMLVVPRVYRACSSVCRVPDGTNTSYREWGGGGITFLAFG